jgi:hypothetical protein
MTDKDYNLFGNALEDLLVAYLKNYPKEKHGKYISWLAERLRIKLDVKDYAKDEGHAK